MNNLPLKIVVKPENPFSVYFMSEDNREVFEVRIRDGHTLEVSSGGLVVKDEEKLYDPCISIIPLVNNRVLISRVEYE